MENDFNGGLTPPEDEYNNKKISNSDNLIQMIYHAVANPKGYRDFLDLSKKRFKRFMCIIMFIVTLMVVGLQIIIFIINVGGIRNFFGNKLPDFVVKDGEIISEGTFDIKMGEFRVLFDAREEYISVSELKDGYTYITIGRKSVNVYVQGTNGRYFSTFSRKINAFLQDGMTNKKLASLTPAFYLALILAFALRMGLFFLKYYILALIYGFYAKGLNMAIGNIHSDQEITRICLVSQTLGIFLVNINKAVGTPIPGFIASFVGVFLTIRRISIYFSIYIGDKGLNA
ncbi:MAG: DUF1189 domain-containing protein [Eubacterium sp.]|nr:DUF1189 domain-containing protein [Eubacterium sp.]